jgi:hypothetical protein
MSSENPVPETLETIAAGIRDLRTAMDSRFGAVDTRFHAVDTRFDELKAQLRTEIESVRDDVRLVAEALAAQTTIIQRQDETHRKLRNASTATTSASWRSSGARPAGRKVPAA